MGVDLFDKCRTSPVLTRPRLAQAMDRYPYFLPLASESGPEVTIDGRQILMFGSNNYLGLTQDHRVKQAAIDAVERYGTSCTGSRLMNGTLELHEELERRIAGFMQKESSLVFTTGFQTNLGVISALVGHGDVVIADRSNHASIVDGTRLSYGKKVKYNHNDMEDLERVLAQHAGSRGMLIVVDGVFSMEGDLANLPEIVRLKKAYGARLMVDEAHGIGAVSARGASEYHGVLDEVDVIMGTFSKSFASTGGFVAATEDVIYYIKHAARSFLFSASISPASAAAALAALTIMETEPEHLDRLRENTNRWKVGLGEIGFQTGGTESPIVPVIVGDENRLADFWKGLLEAGLFANAAVPPAVEEGGALLRTSCVATHQPHHLERGLEILHDVGRKMGVLD